MKGNPVGQKFIVHVIHLKGRLLSDERKPTRTSIRLHLLHLKGTRSVTLLVRTLFSALALEGCQDKRTGSLVDGLKMFGRLSLYLSTMHSERRLLSPTEMKLQVTCFDWLVKVCLVCCYGVFKCWSWKFQQYSSSSMARGIHSELIRSWLHDGKRQQYSHAACNALRYTPPWVLTSVFLSNSSWTASIL